jgi:hypothetical protein
MMGRHRDLLPSAGPDVRSVMAATRFLLAAEDRPCILDPSPDTAHKHGPTYNGRSHGFGQEALESDNATSGDRRCLVYD